MEAISSILETAKERVRNPFFGTLILVWLFRNWIIVFAIFNFDKSHTLDFKIDFIGDYYSNKLFWGIFFNNICLALLLMISSYAFIVLTRMIVNIVDHRITPFLNSKTVSKLVVNTTRFELVKKQRDENFVRLVESQDATVELEQKLFLMKNDKDKGELTILQKDIEIQNNKETIAKYTSDFEEKHLQITELSKEISKLNQLQRDLKLEFSDTKRKYNEYKAIYNIDKDYVLLPNFDLPHLPYIIPDIMLSTYSVIMDNSDQFVHIVNSLNSTNSEKTTINKELVNDYSELGLIEFKSREREKNRASNIELTVLGQEIFNHRVLLNDVLKSMS